MKNLLITLLITLPAIALAQEKGDNLIFVDTGKEDVRNYEEFGAYLVRSGFNIESSSKDFLNIKTGLKDCAWAHYFLNVSFDGGRVLIRPVIWGDTLLGETQFEWDYARSGLNKKVYQDIMDWLPGFGKVEFKKE